MAPAAARRGDGARPRRLRRVAPPSQVTTTAAVRTGSHPPAASGAGAATRGWQLALAGRLRPGYAPPWLVTLPPGVHWLGPLPAHALRALYAAAEIAVSASEYEGFGLTVCEAMASGCAVVAVATSAVPEVVGDAGVLVARSDPALLADALARLIAEPETRAALGAAARARAARFTWEETARQTRRVYEEVLGCA
ncbi:MAG: glycosyltransferase [Deltaproteobacteria bacterium]|nr:MAG: glycosyltransferase [Deltaproteobacteria bacterium]